VGKNTWKFGEHGIKEEVVQKYEAFLRKKDSPNAIYCSTGTEG